MSGEGGKMTSWPGLVGTEKNQARGLTGEDKNGTGLVERSEHREKGKKRALTC